MKWKKFYNHIWKVVVNHKVLGVKPTNEHIHTADRVGLYENIVKFSLKYNKDHFARVSMDTGCKESVSVDSLFELGEIVSRMIGNPTVYYDMSFKKSGIEKINPTLDWCLEKDLVDHYISDIINGRMFDDGGKCLNVRVFDEKINDNSKKRLQLTLK